MEFLNEKVVTPLFGLIGLVLVLKNGTQISNIIRTASGQTVGFANTLLSR